jgi:hypothetical protein
MDETRHGGEEVDKEDETVMDEAQGSSRLPYSRGKRSQMYDPANHEFKCSRTSYRNCDQVLTSVE